MCRRGLGATSISTRVSRGGVGANLTYMDVGNGDPAGALDRRTYSDGGNADLQER